MIHHSKVGSLTTLPATKFLLLLITYTEVKFLHTKFLFSLKK